jgi:hypothetical protein
MVDVDSAKSKPVKTSEPECLVDKNRTTAFWGYASQETGDMAVLLICGVPWDGLPEAQSQFAPCETGNLQSTMVRGF